MYIVFYLSVILLYLILRKFENQEKMKRLYIILMTILLCFCTTFRNLAVGSDTYAYYMGFEHIANKDFGKLIDNFIDSIGAVSNNSNKDLGYPIFTKIANIICLGSFECYQFLISLLVLCPLGYLIYHFVPKFYGYILSYGFYISIFYHYLPNSATRQSIALGLFLCSALLWIKKNKIVWPVTLLFLASTIHKSVLIGILPFALMYINDKSKFIKCTFIGTAIMFVIGGSLTLWLADFANNGNYADYVTSNFYVKQEAGKPIGYILQIFSLFILSLYRNSNINEISRSEQFVRICFYLGIIFAPLILINPSLIRLSAYFSIWGCVFIPNILLHFNDNLRYQQIIFIILFILVLGRPIALGRVAEFKFKWEKMQLHKRYGNAILLSKNKEFFRITTYIFRET